MIRARTWHRRLARMGALAVLLWAGTGLLHPLLGVVGPRPAQFTPPAGAALMLPADSRALVQQAGIPSVFDLRPVFGPGGTAIQVWTTPGTPARYLRPDNAPALTDADYAVWLARYYSGSLAAVQRSEWLPVDTPADATLQRLLPLWRVCFEDGLELLIDTRDDRLLGISHPSRRTLSQIFRHGHTLAFLDGWGWLRPALMSVLLGGLILLALLGLRMALGAGGRTPTRRLHRVLGSVLLLPLLAWSGSGLFHLWLQADVTRSAARTPLAAALPVERLPSGAAFTRIWSDGSQFWARDPQDRWHSDKALLTPAALAAQRAGAAEATATLLTGFSDEYGFINRRLPVWRVATGAGERAYVDLNRGVVVSTSRPLERAEGWSFNWLHKWQFADGLGRFQRDALMAVFAGGLLTLAGVGWSLRRRSARGASA